ncbi:hypothetical protein RJ641_004602 [Dillenia turbinata]|uniref:Uncharacterized protein n=1 Tax=Dillenia turbinata TaxID=194707 RepID=A0AAN8VMQ6_9MAGN
MASKAMIILCIVALVVSSAPIEVAEAVRPIEAAPAVHPTTRIYYRALREDMPARYTPSSSVHDIAPHLVVYEKAKHTMTSWLELLASGPSPRGCSSHQQVRVPAHGGGLYAYGAEERKEVKKVSQSSVEATRVLPEDFARHNHLVVYEKAKYAVTSWLERLASGPSPRGPGH